MLLFCLLCQHLAWELGLLGLKNWQGAAVFLEDLSIQSPFTDFYDFTNHNSCNLSTYESNGIAKVL